MQAPDGNFNCGFDGGRLLPQQQMVHQMMSMVYAPMPPRRIIMTWVDPNVPMTRGAGTRDPDMAANETTIHPLEPKWHIQVGGN